jgi:hypothetical protein
MSKTWLDSNSYEQVSGLTVIQAFEATAWNALVNAALSRDNNEGVKECVETFNEDNNKSLDDRINVALDFAEFSKKWKKAHYPLSGSPKGFEKRRVYEDLLKEFRSRSLTVQDSSTNDRFLFMN